MAQPGMQAGAAGREAALLADQLRRSLGSTTQLDNSLGQVISLLA